MGEGRIAAGEGPIAVDEVAVGADGVGARRRRGGLRRLGRTRRLRAGTKGRSCLPGERRCGGVGRR